MNAMKKRTAEMLGLPTGVDVGKKEWNEAGMRAVRERMVRSQGDEEELKKLSQVKEYLKRLRRRICVCGKRKSVNGERCPECAMAEGRVRGVGNSEEVPVIERGVMIGGRQMPTALSLAMGGLKEVGESFEIQRSLSAIRNEARRSGVGVITRRMSRAGEVPRYRVWRSDGKTREEVNQIIRERLESNESQ